MRQSTNIILKKTRLIIFIIDKEKTFEQNTNYCYSVIKKSVNFLHFLINNN